MSAATEQNASAPAASPARDAAVRLLAAGASLECLLVAGVLLPMRLDRRPPSLQTNLAGVYGPDGRGLALYIALALALPAAYAAGCVAARTAGRRLAVVAVTMTGVFCFTLVPAHPTYSSDVFHYIATARVELVHGENPHVTPPEAIAGDPLMQLSGWKWLASPYGPAWTWLSRLPFAVAGGGNDATRWTIAFKALAALCVIGATAGVAFAAERFRSGSATCAAVLFGWNPVVLIHLAADGHNDAAMLLPLAWGIAALACRRPAVALVLFCAAALIKAVGGIAVVMLVIWLAHRRAWRTIAAGLGAGALLGVALYARYWVGPETLRAMVDEGRYFTNTPASLVQRALEPALGGDPSRLLVGIVARTALLAAVVGLAIRARDTTERLSWGTALALVLAVAVLGTWYQPWYATWPLLFLAAVATGRALAFGLSLALTTGALLVPVAVNFVTEISGRGARDGEIDALTVVLVVSPVALATVLTVRRRGPSAAAPVSSAQ